jgi:hypothetical protein
VIIKVPIIRNLSARIDYLGKEGTTVSSRIIDYAKKWKQSINVQKTVAQVFYSQIKQPKINVYMKGQKLGIVNNLKYLVFSHGRAKCH